MCRNFIFFIKNYKKQNTPGNETIYKPYNVTVLQYSRKGCHRCLVIYEKHKNVLQYKESECEGDSMYMHQTNPSAMAMRSVLNQKPSLGNGGDHRGGAHPNLNGHSRLSSSDQYIMRSNDDMNDCKHFLCFFLFLLKIVLLKKLSKK